MLPRLDANPAIAPLAPARAVAGAAAVGGTPQELFQRSLQTLLGTSMQGQVMARLGDGSFLVRVAGTPARMQLPPGAQVGAEVPLTLIALDPRPSFQVGGGREPAVSVALAYTEAAPDAHAEGAAQAAGARPGSLAASLLGKAPLTPSALLPGFDAGAPPPVLSNTARAIASILTQAESGPAAPLAIIGKTPLMNGPGAAPAALAQSLHEALGASGLFYESHVAEWAEGKRTLPQLMREPQMAAAAAAQGGHAPAGADLASAQLINLQLHTHEQARVLWQGEVWPGQKMEWDVARDAPRHGQDERADEEPAPAWRSGVRFNFPLLGAVSASVTLSGGQVHIQVQTDSEQSAAALRQHAGALERSMEAAGAPLSSLSIGLQNGAGDAE